MPRYVVLFHEMPVGSQRPSHWDFMLEMGEALWTWALDEEVQPGRIVSAQRLPDHRLDYLTYEGPISGNRGDVHRWDQGRFVLLEQSDDRLRLRLHGNRLTCEAILETQNREATAGQCWSVSLRTNG